MMAASPTHLDSPLPPCPQFARCPHRERQLRSMSRPRITRFTITITTDILGYAVQEGYVNTLVNGAWTTLSPARLQILRTPARILTRLQVLREVQALRQATLYLPLRLGPLLRLQGLSPFGGHGLNEPMATIIVRSRYVKRLAPVPPRPEWTLSKLPCLMQQCQKTSSKRQC